MIDANRHHRQAGFSLIEIMVVVAILSILAGSTFVGFGSFGKTIRLQKAKGLIANNLFELSKETVKRKYKKHSVYFEEKYLIIESKIHDQALPLKLKGMGGNCATDEAELEIDNPTSVETVYLNKIDAYWNKLSITSISDGEIFTECVPFLDSDDKKWQYQVQQGHDLSHVIRFIHFNEDLSDESSNVQIESNNYRLDILQPYGEKNHYENGGLLSDATSAVIILKSADGESELEFELP